jgi:hypothetical protein
MDMEPVDCFWLRGTRCTHPRVGGKPCGGPCEQIKPRNPGHAGRSVPLTFAQKALSYAKAEASLLVKGPVGVDELVRRLETCNACDHLKRAEEPGKLGWCTKCGCGEKSRAELTVKGRMPAASCPFGLWRNEEAPRRPLSDELRSAIDA